MNIGDKVYLRNGTEATVIAYKETFFSGYKYLVEYPKERVDTEEVRRYVIRRWKRYSQLGLTKPNDLMYGSV